MRFKKISIKNLMGIPDLQFYPKTLTEISGKNGLGKTTVIDALRLLVDRKHDPDRIRTGAEFAEVLFETNTGCSYRVHVTKTRTTWDFRDEKGHKITAAAEHIESIINAISLDPVRFLQLKPKDQVDAFLAARPLRVNAEDLAFLPVSALDGVDLEKHALEVIGGKSGGIYKTLYDERAVQNRIAKEKRATAKQMAETLPEEPQDGDWHAEYERIRNEFAHHEVATRKQVEGIDAEAAQGKAGIDSEVSERTNLLRSDFEAEVAKLRAAFDADCDKARADGAIAKQKIEERQRNEREKLRSVYEPKRDALKEELGRVQANLEAQAKAEKTGEFIAAQEREADKAEAQSEKLSTALKQLEALKTKLASESPIPGLEIAADGLVLNGVPFRIVNEAEKIRIALEIAKLQLGECEVILVDNLEHLDSDNYERFRAACLQSGLQFIGARVADTDLEVASV